MTGYTIVRMIKLGRHWHNVTRTVGAARPPWPRLTGASNLRHLGEANLAGLRRRRAEREAAHLAWVAKALAPAAHNPAYEPPDLGTSYRLARRYFAAPPAPLPLPPFSRVEDLPGLAPTLPRGATTAPAVYAADDPAPVLISAQGERLEGFQPL